MKKTNSSQPNNPLHGVKLADMLEYLVAVYGWRAMGQMINIRCFKNNPSHKSSLSFLRKTPWARLEVENLYREQMGLEKQPKKEVND